MSGINENEEEEKTKSQKSAEEETGEWWRGFHREYTRLVADA